jgi:hypothetical protein
MLRFQRSMIVMYIGFAVMMMLGYFAVKACSGASDLSSSDLGSVPAVADRAKDGEASSNGRLIVAAIESYLGETGHLPAVADVTASGALAGYTPGWPVNPFTQQPMKSGSSPGDFTYQPSADGGAYTFTLASSSGPIQLH